MRVPFMTISCTDVPTPAGDVDDVADDHNNVATATTTPIITDYVPHPAPATTDDDVPTTNYDDVAGAGATTLAATVPVPTILSTANQ
jgi:hypothetical protein